MGEILRHIETHSLKGVVADEKYFKMTVIQFTTLEIRRPLNYVANQSIKYYFTSPNILTHHWKDVKCGEIKLECKFGGCTAATFFWTLK